MAKQSLVFFAVWLKVGEGIGLGSYPELGIINMRIYLSGVKIIVP